MVRDVRKIDRCQDHDRDPDRWIKWDRDPPNDPKDPNLLGNWLFQPWERQNWATFLPAPDPFSSWSLLLGLFERQEHGALTDIPYWWGQTMKKKHEAEKKIFSYGNRRLSKDTILYFSTMTKCHLLLSLFLIILFPRSSLHDWAVANQPLDEHIHNVLFSFLQSSYVWQCWHICLIVIFFLVLPNTPISFCRFLSLFGERQFLFLQSSYIWQCWHLCLIVLSFLLLPNTPVFFLSFFIPVWRMKVLISSFSRLAYSMC